MKLSAFAVVTIASLSVSAVASASPVSRFSGTGAYASGNAYSGNSSVNISVYEGGTPQNREAWLYYAASGCGYTDSDTKWGCSGAWLSGPIPAADFSVGGGNRAATLNTSGSSLSGYSYSYSCELATWTCTYNYTNGAPGPIVASWRKTSEFSSHHSGTSEVDYYAYKFLYNGTSKWSSAAFTVNAFGNVFASEQGAIGTSRNASIVIDKTH